MKFGKPKIAMLLCARLQGCELAAAHLPENQQMQDQQHLSTNLRTDKLCKQMKMRHHSASDSRQLVA